MKLSAFSKQETRFLMYFFLFLFLLAGYNLNISLRKGRDNQRKNDLSVLQKALDQYHARFGVFPPSENGLIKGCFASEPQIDMLTNRPINMQICNWGKSSFENLFPMPRDPSASKGHEYLYISDTETYKIYIALEGKSEAEYNKETEKKGLQCGIKVCNYGREY